MNCLFGAVKLTRNAIKNKFTCNSYGIAFYGANSRSFANEFPLNVSIFGAINSSSITPGNRKNNLFILDVGPTDYINNSVGDS